MRNLMLMALLALCARSWAASYYVSSSGGSDANNGTSVSTPWQTLGAHVNGGTFSPGDVIYLKRGDRWNEQLIPPSSGNSGSGLSRGFYLWQTPFQQSRGALIDEQYLGPGMHAIPRGKITRSRRPRRGWCVWSKLPQQIRKAEYGLKFNSGNCEMVRLRSRH